MRENFKIQSIKITVLIKYTSYNYSTKNVCKICKFH